MRGKRKKRRQKLSKCRTGAWKSWGSQGQINKSKSRREE